MSTLESLVPSLELCKLIPKESFADSALAYYSGSLCWRVVGPAKGKIIPAPTLAEILMVLPLISEHSSNLRPGVWLDVDSRTFIAGYDDIKATRIAHKNPATAALTLWLKLNGVKGK